MNHTLSDSQLKEMIKSAVNSSGPLPPDEKFSQLVSALRELQERRKAEKDSEPVAWTWNYREQWHVTNDKCRAEFVAKDGDVAVLPLYRHAQPAPVVMDDEKLRALFDAWFASDCSFDQSPEASEADNIAWRESYWYVWQHCRAAMLQAGNSPAQVADRPVAWHHTAKSKGENHSTCCFSYAPSHDFGPWYEKPQSQPHYLPERLDYDRALHFLSTEPRKLTEETLTAGITPIIPDGYVMVPMRLTAENGAKGALSGEFSETRFVNCPECFGDDECETCDGSGKIEITVPVTWTTIKEIWAKGVEHFSATPREVKGE